MPSKKRGGDKLPPPFKKKGPWLWDGHGLFDCLTSLIQAVNAGRRTPFGRNATSTSKPESVIFVPLFEVLKMLLFGTLLKSFPTCQGQYADQPCARGSINEWRQVGYPSKCILPIPLSLVYHSDNE